MKVSKGGAKVRGWWRVDGGRHEHQDTHRFLRGKAGKELTLISTRLLLLRSSVSRATKGTSCSAETLLILLFALKTQTTIAPINEKNTLCLAKRHPTGFAFPLFTNTPPDPHHHQVPQLAPPALEDVKQSRGSRAATQHSA